MSFEAIADDARRKTDDHDGRWLMAIAHPVSMVLGELKRESKLDVCVRSKNRCLPHSLIPPHPLIKNWVKLILFSDHQ